MPVTVRVNAGPPPTIVDGDNTVSAGKGLLIVNVIAADVPPTGAGLNTVTGIVPAAARSPIGTTAEICVALVNVVTSATPFQSTTELETKPVPSM